jgi:hypothetical protein
MLELKELDLPLSGSHSRCRGVLMVEARLDRKERLQAEGKWADWVRIRDELKKSGVAPKEAAEMAALEVDAPGFVPKPIPTEALNVGAVACNVSGEQGHEATTISKEIWVGRDPCTPLQAGIWAGENLRVGDAKPEDAPSSLAWAWLLEMRDNPKIREGFFNAVLPRSFQSSKEVEKDEQMRDDGRRVLGLISEVFRASERANAVLSPGAEGVFGEPEIQAGDDTAGEQEL